MAAITLIIWPRAAARIYFRRWLHAGKQWPKARREGRVARKGLHAEAIYAEARATPARIQFTKFPEAAVNLANEPGISSSSFIGTTIFAIDTPQPPIRYASELPEDVQLRKEDRRGLINWQPFAIFSQTDGNS